MDQAVIFSLAAIIIVGGALFAVIALMGRKGSKYLDVEKYRTSWLKIEQNLKKTEPIGFNTAVMEADKLVDQSLKERGFVGSTMGERMKSANQAFSDRNGVWAAHKLRNQIAHESGFSVTYDQARTSLSRFKQALKDLGAI
jgi:hypothetical protein